jgi:UDPglucose 6-dehydrogenase
MTTVCVIGLWHLGSVTSACLADLGYAVVGYDSDKNVIENISRGKPPIFEPRLEEMIKKNLENGRLRFTSSPDSIGKADYISLTIDTPVDDNDNIDLTTVYDAISMISKIISENSIIIIQSQVPVGTCDDFVEKLKQKRPDVKFGLAYCPENLRLGKAIDIFQNPDRIIIGANDEQTQIKAKELFDVINCPKILMDLKSAEMTKHSINAFLATCISFINWIGNLCEEVGADAKKVSEGLMSEQRIGRNLPLRSGLGFSGGTLGRDLKILTKLGNELGVKPDLIEAVLKTNREQNILVIKKLLKIFGSIDGLKVGILGLTYKPGTNTLRRSISLEIIDELLQQNAKVGAYDPSIKQIISISHKNFELNESAYGAATNADALILFTDWPEFKEVNYEKIFHLMKKPIILDMKNFLDDKQLKKIGFEYLGIGT